MANVSLSQQQQLQQQRSNIELANSIDSPPGGEGALLTSLPSSSNQPPLDQPPPPPRVPLSFHRSPLAHRAQSVSPQRCFLPRPCPVPPDSDDLAPPPPLHPRRVGGGASQANRSSVGSGFKAAGVHAISVGVHRHRQSNPEHLLTQDVKRADFVGVHGGVGLEQLHAHDGRGLEHLGARRGFEQPGVYNDKTSEQQLGARNRALPLVRGFSAEEQCMSSDTPPRLRTSAPPLRSSSVVENEDTAWRRTCSDRSATGCSKVNSGFGTPGSVRGGKILQNGARVLQRGERIGHNATENLENTERHDGFHIREGHERFSCRETHEGLHKGLQSRESHEFPRSRENNGEVLDARLRVRRQGMRRGDSDPVERSRLLDHRASPALSSDIRLLEGRFAAGDIMSSNHSTPQGSFRGLRGQRTTLQHVVPLDRWPFNSAQQSNQPQQRPETHFVLDRINRRPAGNEYVDEPSTAHHVEIVENRLNHELSHAANGQTHATHVNIRDCREVLTCQPPSSGTPKSLQAVDAAKCEAEPAETRHPDDVVCSQCGLCRCRNCMGRLVGGGEGVEEGAGTDLPSCWLAGGRYECSLQSCMDRASCVCCLRTLFYHCLYDEDDDVDIVAQPFSCTEAPHCCARWSIITALMPFMPCLALYALTEPIRCTLLGYLRCRESCRIRGRQGCRCTPGQGGEAPSLSTATTSTSSGTTRSLLVDSPEHSSA